MVGGSVIEMERGADVARYKNYPAPLPHAEVMGLIDLWQQEGGKEARDKVILYNMRMVVKAARIMGLRYGHEISEYEQEGVFGLIKAIDKFDTSTGFKFGTYAMWWVRQAMQRAVSSQYTITLPVRAHEEFSPVWKIMKKHPEMTVEEAIDSLHVGERSKRTLRSMASVAVESMDKPIGDDIVYGDTFKDEGPGPEHAVYTVEQKARVEEVVKKLPVRQSEVLKLRFGLFGEEPQTLQSIGEMFGVTRERVRQIEMSALKETKRLLRKAS